MATISHKLETDLIKCVEPSTDVSPTPDVIILDGAAIVQMLTTRTVHTQVIFLPYVWKQLYSAKRVDIVWDEYREDLWEKESLWSMAKGFTKNIYSL